MDDGVRRALEGAADLGGFFGLGIDAGDADGRGGCTAAELYAPGSPALPAIVARMRARLGGEDRAVASVAHLGYAARLVSPVLAVALLADAVLVVPAADLFVVQEAGGGLRLSAGAGARLAALSAEAVRDTVAAHLEPFAAHLRTRYRLAPALLRGNAASALAGAVRVLPGALRQRGAALAEEVLALPPFAGTLRASGVRRSCCLYYRLPGGGTCGDCPLGQRG